MGWGTGAGNVDEFSDITFEFEGHINEILPQLAKPNFHQSDEARRVALASAAVSAPTGMSSQKLEEKFRTVVCRHWLRNLCMKGESCEFLHQYDVDRMPDCRWGTNCKITDCPYRHVGVDDKPPCVFYQQGFCIHGLQCRYRHFKQPASKRPLVADFSLGIMMNSTSKPETDGDATMPLRLPDPPRIQRQREGQFTNSLCKHYMGSSCPYGDACKFAHGKEEISSDGAPPPRLASRAANGKPAMPTAPLPGYPYPAAQMAYGQPTTYPAAPYPGQSAAYLQFTAYGMPAPLH